MPDPPQPRPRRQGRRWLWIAASLTLLPALLLFVAGALLLRSEEGRRLLVELAERAVERSSDYRLELRGLEGPLPQRLALAELILSDRAGELLRLEALDLVWDPWSLLGGELAIERLEAAKVSLRRLPQGEEPGASDSAAPFALESLRAPLAVTLQRLAIAELTFEPPVLGESASFEVRGAATAGESGELDLELAVHRLGDPAAELSGRVRFDPGTQYLTAALTLEEPGGGLMARMLELPGLPPLSVTLAGEGPLSAWHGSLQATAGDLARLALDLRLAGGTALQLELAGTAEVASLLPEDLRMLAAPRLEISALGLREEGGALVLTEGRLRSDALEIALTGRLEPEGEGVTAAVAGEAKDLRAMASLLRARRLAGLVFEGSLAGSFAEPRLAVHAVLARPDFLEARAERLDLRLEFPGTTDSHRRIEADATLEGLEIEGLPMEGLRAAPVRLAAHLEPGPGLAQLVLSEAVLEAPAIAAKARGALDLLRLEGDLDIAIAHADLALLREVTELGLEGRLEGEQSLRFVAKGIEGRFAGRLEGPALGVAEVDALLTPEMEVATELRLAPDGALGLEGLRLEGERARLTGNLALDSSYETISAEWALAVADLAALSQPLGLAIAGAADAIGRLGGTLVNPELETTIRAGSLTLEGVAVSDLEARLRLADLAERLNGRLEARSGSAFGRLELDGSFQLEPEALVLSKARLQRGEDRVTSGTLTVPLDGGPLTGSLDVEAARLADWSGHAGVPLSGRASGRVVLAAERDLQVLNFTVAGRGLGIASTSIAKLEASGRIEDPFAELRLDGKAVLSDVRPGELGADELRLDEATVALAGNAGALRLEATARGSPAGSLEAALEAEIRRTAAETRITLARLEGRVAGQALRLSRPARLLIAPPRYELADLALLSDLGNVNGSLVYAPRQLDLDLQVEAMELAKLRRFLPGLALRGTAAASARLTGMPEAPQGGFTLDFGELTVLDPELASLPPLTARLDGRLQPGELLLRGRAGGFAERPLELDLKLPVRLSAEPARIELPREAPIEGRIAWSGRAGEIMAFLPVDSLSLRGKGAIDLALGGTLAAPQLYGSIALTEGRYENYTSATLLRPLEMVITAEGDRLVLSKVEAGDGNGGRITAEGVIRIGDLATLTADATASFERATLVRRDDVMATVSGELRFAGGLKSARASGAITVNQAEVRIVDKLPPSVVTLEVVEKDASAGAAKGSAGAGAAWLALDLEVELPGRVFVRGRGLDSEWEGRFKITGTAREPIVEGKLSPVRGSFSFAGKTFELQDGTISFGGEERIDPQLDLAALYRGSGFDATVRIQGSASAPAISLSSVPELPQDEILSRILFNKTTARLSAAEGLQLADAVATLTGTGGPSALDLARRTLGVDVLRFGTDASGAATVTVGEYLTDQVFVGVQQGPRADSTGVTVEVEITPNVTMESEVGTDQSGKVGLRWRWDY